VGKIAAAAATASQCHFWGRVGGYALQALAGCSGTAWFDDITFTAE
jgi:hypothetical protein